MDLTALRFPTHDDDPMLTAAMLRKHGSTRRGLPDTFLRLIAEQARHAEHPVKTLAELHGVDKSTASRWLKAARWLP
jgi:DNA-binding MarR family transcriptional regulator